MLSVPFLATVIQSLFYSFTILHIIIYCPLQNGNLTRVQDLVRAVNPTVNFILTDRGELTRSQDIDLILSDSAFLHPDNVRARLLMSRSVLRHERLFISHKYFLLYLFCCLHNSDIGLTVSLYLPIHDDNVVNVWHFEGCLPQRSR